MSSNRSLAQKLQDQLPPTPRVDRFARSLKQITLQFADFEDPAARIRLSIEIDALNIAWAEFARDLERELKLSVPKEWQP